MKYLIVLGDGMADKNIPELDNRTPLDYADTPAICLLYTSPSPRDRTRSRMPSSA